VPVSRSFVVVVLQSEQGVGNQLAVIGLERLEAGPDRIDLGPGKRGDRLLAGFGASGSAGTGDSVFAVFGGDDGHRVGVTERVAASGFVDEAFARTTQWRPPGGPPLPGQTGQRLGRHLAAWNKVLVGCAALLTCDVGRDGPGGSGSN